MTQAKDVYSSPINLGDLGDLVNDEVSSYQDDPVVGVENLQNEKTTTVDSERKIEESRTFILDERVSKETTRPEPKNQGSQQNSAYGQQAKASSYGQSSYGQQQGSTASQQGTSAYGQQQRSGYYGSYGSNYVSPEEAARRAAEEAQKKALQEAEKRSKRLTEYCNQKFYEKAKFLERSMTTDDEDIFSRMEAYELQRELSKGKDRQETLYKYGRKADALGYLLTSIFESGRSNIREDVKK